ncbi:MAG: hypothetical protein LE168_02170, partial [Endomicrobium sp.]|nr:hypothetical protein [Endomicrobium sp.]
MLSIILSSCSKGNDVARVEPVADEDVKTELAAPRDESALTEVRRDDPPLTTPTSLPWYRNLYSYCSANKGECAAWGGCRHCSRYWGGCRR